MGTMLKCRQCGELNQPGPSNCDKCGAALRGAERVEVTTSVHGTGRSMTQVTSIAAPSEMGAHVISGAIGGAVVGFVLGLLTRPSVPLVGQLPIGVVLTPRRESERHGHVAEVNG